MCAQQVLTQTRQKRRLDSMCSISRTEGVSRVLSSTRRTAAADAHMQSWMAVMLDQKRPKTAVRFDVHISETKTRAGHLLPCQKRWSILACACFSRGKSHRSHARYTCAEVMGPWWIRGRLLFMSLRLRSGREEGEKMKRVKNEE